jgi:spore germination protein GerM
MSRHVRTGLGAAALAVGALGVVGCGIPTDDSPRAISSENVPDDVADDTTEPTPSQSTVSAPIYLVQSSEDPRLAPVQRPVPSGSPGAGPDPAAVLETLLTATANPQERAAGITNLIPEDTHQASQPELTGGTLEVDLTSGIFDVEGENQRAAFGQIVCTANGLAGVNSVRFLVEGEPRNIPTDAGEADGPVNCERDYRRLMGGSAAG